MMKITELLNAQPTQAPRNGDTAFGALPNGRHEYAPPPPLGATMREFASLLPPSNSNTTQQQKQRKMDMASLDQFAQERQQQQQQQLYQLPARPILVDGLPRNDPAFVSQESHAMYANQQLRSLSSESSSHHNRITTPSSPPSMETTTVSSPSGIAAVDALTALANAASYALSPSASSSSAVVGKAKASRSRQPRHAEGSGSGVAAKRSPPRKVPAAAEKDTKKAAAKKKKATTTSTSTAVASANTKNLSVTEEEKRAKQRMLVKRSYYRKIDTLTTLRETVCQLEKDYHAISLAEQQKTKQQSAAAAAAAAVAQQQQQQQQQAAPSRHSIASLVGASPSTPSSPTTQPPPAPITAEDKLKQSFQEMAVSIDHLRRENEGLREIAMEQSKVSTRVGILVQEEFQDQVKRGHDYADLLQTFPPTLRTPEEHAAASRARRGSSASATSSPNTSPRSPTQAPDGNASPIVLLTPITEDECMEIARDAYAEIMQFRKSTNYVTTGSEVFGWRDRRKVCGDYVQFALEKTFLYRTAQQVATRTWNMLSTERGINRIYSSSIRANYHFVQQVSPHNAIFYRTMEHAGQNVLLKSLILASLVQTEDGGYLVLFRSIDPEKRNVRDAVTRADAQAMAMATAGVGTVAAVERKEIWVDMFSWGLFEAAGPNGEHCVDFFGGFVPAPVATSISFWMMEVLLIAVRCESECVGPLFILPHEKEGDDGASSNSSEDQETTVIVEEEEEDGDGDVEMS